MTTKICTKCGLPKDAEADFSWSIRGIKRHPQCKSCRSKDIQTVEALHWSWSKVLRGGLIGAIAGIIIGTVLLIPDSGMNVGLSGAALNFGITFALMGVILSGLRPQIIETKSSPNQGIRRSIRNAILGGLISGLIFGLSIGPFMGKWPTSPLFFGLTCGLAGVLWYGGLDVIQHYVLRLILVLQARTPANFARFLDYTVDRIFLQRVGGGYRFTHRLLLEHFSDMDETRKVLKL